MHFLAEILLGGLLHLVQYKRRDFRLAISLVAYFSTCITIVSLHDFIRKKTGSLLYQWILNASADQPFYGGNRVLRICDRLPPGNLSDQSLAALGKSNNGRSCATTLGIGQNIGVATLHDRHARVGRP